jgi:hypothetical protein
MATDRYNDRRRSRTTAPRPWIAAPGVDIVTTRASVSGLRDDVCDIRYRRLRSYNGVGRRRLVRCGGAAQVSQPEPERGSSQGSAVRVGANEAQPEIEMHHRRTARYRSCQGRAAASSVGESGLAQMIAEASSEGIAERVALDEATDSESGSTARSARSLPASSRCASCRQVDGEEAQVRRPSRILFRASRPHRIPPRAAGGDVEGEAQMAWAKMWRSKGDNRSLLGSADGFPRVTDVAERGLPASRRWHCWGWRRWLGRRARSRRRTRGAAGLHVAAEGRGHCVEAVGRFECAVARRITSRCPPSDPSTSPG